MALGRRESVRWWWRTLAGLAVFGAFVIARPVAAQEEGLELRLRRTFGYAWGAEVQGSFLLIAEGPVGVREVSFFVDDGLLETVDAPPFQARLHTGDYPLGVHRLRAEGSLSDGSTLTSNVIEANFVPASASWQAAGRILTPILVIAGLAMAAGIGLVAFSSRRFRAGQYGAAGGAVCPRCALPMARHFLAPNLGGKKLERCPHCGRWSRVARATAQALEEAEARLLSEAGPAPNQGQEKEALRRQVDDSRFVD